MKLREIKPKTKQAPFVKQRIANPLDLKVNIRAMRQQKGLSLRDCVKPSGISSATFLRVECGALPDLPTAFRMAHFLDLPIESIWNLRDAATSPKPKQAVTR